MCIRDRPCSVVRPAGGPSAGLLPWEADHALVSSETLAALRQRMEKFEIAGRFGTGAWYEDDGTGATAAKQTVGFLCEEQLLPPGDWV
eukprot:5031936-Alexandrium_andersonii.AAC.1